MFADASPHYDSFMVSVLWWSLDFDPMSWESKGIYFYLYFEMIHLV